MASGAHDDRSSPSSVKEKAAGGALAFVTSRPVAITMLMVAIGVFGIVSLSKLPVDLLPEISYPTLTVRTTYPGAAPEDVEDRISERIQEALSTLPHLVRSMSISRAETSDVVLDFDWGTPMTFAVQDVRDKLDSVFLPNGAERPLILRYDPNLDPILRIGLSLPLRAAPRADGDATAGATKTESGGARDVGARASERDLVQLRWIAENRVKRELETIPGVAAVQVRGGLEEEIRVRVDPFKMAAQGLDPAVIATRLAQENLNASGGAIREGSTEYLVRTLNEFRDVGEIARLSIVRRGEANIRIGDVATVERTHAQRDVITRLDGGEAVEIAIYREAGANIVALADAVHARVFGAAAQREFTQGLQEQEATSSDEAKFENRDKTDFLAWQLRKDARLEVLSDQSTFIRDSIEDVKSNAWMAVVLTVLVIWLALRSLLPTLIISISIPISVVVTFAPMYLLDVSLNIMSLGGLALGVGMVVDASIVVLESIMRCREEGDSLTEAAVRGTREVAGAVTGSTLTSVAVFAPIVFVHGVAGRIFGDQALTVVASVLVSLVVAALFIPVLASRPWLAGATTRAVDVRKPAPLKRDLKFDWAHLVPSLASLAGRGTLRSFGICARVFGALLLGLGKLLDLLFRPILLVHDWAWGHVERVYPRLLATGLRNAWLVVFVSVALFAVAVWRVPALGLDLLPEIHQGEFTAHVGLPVGSPLEQTDQVLGEIDRSVHAIEGVQLTALTVGVEKDTLTRDIEGKHTARLTVRLKPESATPENEDRIMARVRELIAQHPAVRSVDISRPTPFALDAPVQIEVLGYDLELLSRTAAEVAARISEVPGLTDVQTTVRPGHPEARITFDRDKTLEYGLDLDAVSRLVRDQVLGNVSTRFSEGDDRIDVRVLGDEIVLSSLGRVLDIVVNPSSTTPVPLRAVADVQIVQGPAEIRRIGNTRAVLVTASTTGLDLGGSARAIEKSLADMVTPDDVVVQLGGQKREMDEAQASMRFALLLALFLVYAVMASQFESWLQPLIILVTVPLAIVGVVFTLDWLDIPLSVVVFIGLILLAGIVVANAIVLLDRVNQTRAQGYRVYDALIEAGSTRLRPIYMTANTTVIGLLPMTGWLADVPWIGPLCAGAGLELRAPMAIAVMSGLTCSTALTLIVIPAVYYLVYRHQDVRAPVAATSAETAPA
ncbi:MAG: efflux RND transporter permease subunit [Planctomycetota bacterium]